MSRPSCKERILECADIVALEGGAANLTLDAVAERAGVSKGGVLYHFPTKDALLAGMVARQLEMARTRRIGLAGGDDSPGAAARADILATLTRPKEDNRVSAALLAAVANQPRLLEPALCFHRERFLAIAGEGADDTFAQRAMAALAADGLFFLELLQISPFSPAQREALLSALLAHAAKANMHVAEEGEAQPNATPSDRASED